MTIHQVLLRSTLVAALGGLLFGFDTAVIAGVTRAVSENYSLSPGGLGFTVAMALWGTVFGAIFAGPLGDRLGRTASLRATAALYVVSAIGCAFAWDWYALLLFRFIGGLAIGGSSVVGPMYIAETSPAKWRGRLVGLFQFNVVVGVLLAYFSNYVIGLMGFGEFEWRWKLGVSAAPAVLFFVALFSIPQSPRWLVARGRLQEAGETLAAIGEPDPQSEVQEILESIRSQQAVHGERLFSRKYRLPIFLVVSIAMFNQLSGINAIIYYLNDIFERAGFSKVSSDMQAVAIGFTNLVFTMLAIALIDRIGRKRLLLTGSVGMAFCLAGIAFIFSTGQHKSLLLWLLITFIAFFAFSQGAVIWVYLSEVFPNLVRAKGQSLGTFMVWLTNALIAGLFPLVAAASGAIPFAFFAAMMVVQFFVVLFVYPETKGLSLEHLQDTLQEHKPV